MQSLFATRSGFIIGPGEIFIILLLIGLFLLFRKGGKVGRLIIIVPVVLLPVAVLTLFFMRATFHKRVATKHIGPMPHPSVVYIESNNITPPIWKDDIAKQFQVTEPSGFSAKPWVDDFADYINRNPKGHWLLARSQNPAATEQEARRQAMTNACGQVARLLQERGQLNRPVSPGDIRRGGFIEDRFVQKLQGLSGPIWREAMLINGAPEKLEMLAREITNATAQQRQSKRTMILSLLGMLAVISGVYLFLNAATRGYYTWSIRIMLIILTGAGVFLVLTIS
ncbi:MAG: hypothetical protein KAT56_06355 [Sedimentisphaerales bacterium]|nr:hypothetical protein [Sedimentisphaerales bacterium]